MQLTDAIAKLCSEMQTTSQAEITLDLQAEDLRLSPDEEDAVYRIVQESITNAIRARTRNCGARVHHGGGAPPRHHSDGQRLRLHEN